METLGDAAHLHFPGGLAGTSRSFAVDAFRVYFGPVAWRGPPGAFRGLVARRRAEGPLGGLLGTCREDAGSGLGTLSADGNIEMNSQSAK